MKQRSRLAGCLALLFTGLAARTWPKDPLVIDDFEKPSGNFFSDKDELPSSPNSISGRLAPGLLNGKAMRIDYWVTPLPQLGYAYAGVSFPVPGYSLKGYRAISFFARLAGGEAPALRLQLDTSAPQKFREAVNVNLFGLSHSWTQYRVELRPFKRSADNHFESIKRASLIVTGGRGAIEIDQLQADNDRGELEPVPTPPKSKAALPKGHGAWCYENMGMDAARILEYNAKAPETLKIRYAFAWGGDFEVVNSRPMLRLDFKDPLKLAGLLQGSGVQVYPIVDGVSWGADALNAMEWEKLGLEVADAVDAQPSLAGLHFDIEPHIDNLHAFFAAFKRHSPKPLSVAVSDWNIDTFHYVDQIVLMGYDQSKNLQGFRDATLDQYRRFLTDARATGTKALIGIPMTATHQEYEGTSTAPQGPITPSGHKMSEFADAAIRSVTDAVIANDPSYLGMSVWALSTPGALHNRGDQIWYYPTEIPEDVLMKLAKPLGGAGH